MSDFALVRKKKAIAEKIEALRGQSREKGRCWGGLHLPKSSIYALLDALDHLYMRPPMISSKYEKTVECLFITKYEHEVNKRGGSADRLQLPPDIIFLLPIKLVRRRNCTILK